MDTNTIKNHLHGLIDETDDVQLLSELVEQIEQAKNGADWWETLTESRQQRILESEEQYKKGAVVSNEVVMKKIQTWLSK